MTIFDLVMLKYPGIQRVSYWNTCPDGAEWDDPYDGLIWENEEVPKPSKEDIANWMKDSDLLAKYKSPEVVESNSEILKQLEAIDLKSIRALRTNDTNRLQALEQQAVVLRNQLIK